MLDLSNMQIDAGQLEVLSAEVRLARATAALTEVDVRRNMLDEAVLEQLRAAAPETCKILAD